LGQKGPFFAQKESWPRLLGRGSGEHRYHFTDPKFDGPQKERSVPSRKLRELLGISPCSIHLQMINGYNWPIFQPAMLVYRSVRLPIQFFRIPTRYGTSAGCFFVGIEARSRCRCIFPNGKGDFTGGSSIVILVYWSVS